jgi:cold shock CspA family protein
VTGPAVACLGTVVAFDDQRGLGTVRDEQGAELPFHATEIVGGTRTIAVGTPVRFVRRAAHLGAWEAAAVDSR